MLLKQKLTKREIFLDDTTLSKNNKYFQDQEINLGMFCKYYHGNLLFLSITSRVSTNIRKIRKIRNLGSRTCGQKSHMRKIYGRI